ncbi:Panacea domain-containing protein [Spiroplasma phoeniceum]|uniref:Uncharacterized protein n=1 Tax=Spiroplasma phoeniceum P40 TaxID=1276259 RepID=A0A345DLP1_9MOLU|nr:hypothetical protein [Spiroplasma phoeniceum]AXF95129.1 hypothetical protein SDAV_00113 [Spiroplasma phoeniceum P40]
MNELTNLEILELDSLLFELNKFSAFGLANLSHECEPWKQTPKNEYISDEKIINYYSNNLSELLNLNHYTLFDLNIIIFRI